MLTVPINLLLFQRHSHSHAKIQEKSVHLEYLPTFLLHFDQFGVESDFLAHLLLPILVVDALYEVC